MNVNAHVNHLQSISIPSYLEGSGLWVSSWCTVFMCIMVDAYDVLILLSIFTISYYFYESLSYLSLAFSRAYLHCKEFVPRTINNINVRAQICNILFGGLIGGTIGGLVAYADLTTFSPYLLSMVVEIYVFLISMGVLQLISDDPLWNIKYAFGLRVSRHVFIHIFRMGELLYTLLLVCTVFVGRTVLNAPDIQHLCRHLLHRVVRSPVAPTLVFPQSEDVPLGDTAPTPLQPTFEFSDLVNDLKKMESSTADEEMGLDQQSCAWRHRLPPVQCLSNPEERKKFFSQAGCYDLAKKVINLTITIADFAGRERQSAIAILAFARNLVRDLSLGPALEEGFISCVKALYTSCTTSSSTEGGAVLVEPQALDWDTFKGSFGEFGHLVSKGRALFAKKLLALLAGTVLAPHLLKSSGEMWRLIGRLINKRKTKDSLAEDALTTVWDFFDDTIDWIMSDRMNMDVSKTLTAAKAMREYYKVNKYTLSATQRVKWKDDFHYVHRRLVELFEKEVKKGNITHINTLDREREMLHACFVEILSIRPESSKEPLALIISGAAGIGKSLLSNLIMDAVGMLLQGSVYDPSQVTAVGPTKFWDNLDNATKVVIIDDIMAGVLKGTPPGSQMVNSRIGEALVSIVNSMVWQPNMASLDQKGKTFPDISLLLCTANVENQYGDMAMMRCPTAAARRVVMMQVELKTEFTGPDGKLSLSLIDGNVIDNCPWRITIREYDVAAAERANKDTIATKLVPSAFRVTNLRVGDESVPMQDVDSATVVKWVKQRVSDTSSRGSLADELRGKARQRLAHLVTPESLFDRSFYAEGNCGQWMSWVCSGQSACTRDEANAALWRCSKSYLACLMACYRVAFLFPLFLAFACVTSRVPRGFVGTMKLFYTMTFADLAIGIVTGQSSSFFSRNLAPLARSYCSSWARGASGTDRLLTNSVRMARVQARLVSGKVDLYHRPIMAGIFAGFSLYAVRAFIKRMRSDAPLLGNLFRTWHPSEPQSAGGAVDLDGILNGSPPNSNGKIVARSNIYSGLHGGNNTNTTTGDGSTVVPSDPCISENQALSRCAHSVCRIVVAGLSEPSLDAEVEGTRVRQFLLLLGPRNTGAIALTNAHVFAAGHDWYSVQVFWNPGRPNKPFILNASTIATGADLPPHSLAGVQGILDLAAFTVPDFGSVPLLDRFVAKSADLSSKSPPVKRLACKDYKTEFCHVDGMLVEPAEVRGPLAIRYPFTCLKDKQLVAVEVAGTGTAGQCGLPVFCGGVLVGVHIASRGSSDEVEGVLIAPVTTSILDTLRTRLDLLESNLAAKSGTAGANLAMPESLFLNGPCSRFLPGPLVAEFDVHPLSVIRSFANNPKYSIMGSIGDKRVTFRSEYSPNPLKSFFKQHIPIVKDIIDHFGPPSSDLSASVQRMHEFTSEPTRSDADVLRLAEQHVYDYFEKAFVTVGSTNKYYLQMGPTTVDVALSGFGLTLSGIVNVDTSAGQMPGAKKLYLNKYHSEDVGRDVLSFLDDEASASIRSTVLEGLDRLAVGSTLSSPAKVVFKDEPLPLESCVDGVRVPKPPRLIHSGEFYTLVIFRMFFMPVLTVMGADPISFGHFVGLNPTQEFGRLYNHLGACDENSYMAMDYSKFDLRTSVNLINSAVNIIITLTTHMTGYTDEHRRMMKTMCYDICNPIYDIDGAWVRFTGSNSSGNPITTMLNCIVNHLCWNQMWLMASHDRAVPSMCGHYSQITPKSRSFYSIFKVVVLGDDCIVTAPVDFWFNQLVAAEYATRIGHVLTAAVKGAEITPFTRGVTFLKREIHVYPHSSGKHLVLAPLALTSLLRPLAWGTWKVGLLEHFAGLIKGMLTELVQHGPEVYDDYVVQFRNLIAAIHVEHQQRHKSFGIRENLSSYFDDSDFRSWRERIMEMYDLDTDDLLGEPVIIV